MEGVSHRGSRSHSQDAIVPVGVPAGAEVARGNFRVAVGVPAKPRSRSAEGRVTAAHSSGDGWGDEVYTPERRCSLTDTYVPLPGPRKSDADDWDEYVCEGEPWVPDASDAALPQGNCRQFHPALSPMRLLRKMLGGECEQMCKCGQRKDAACHHIPHVCLICGNQFTAAENSALACMRHPMDKIKIVGSHAHAVHKYNTYIWECCPDKPQRCSSEQMFMDKRIPHGHHV